MLRAVISAALLAIALLLNTSGHNACIQPMRTGVPLFPVPQRPRWHLRVRDRRAGRVAARVPEARPTANLPVSWMAAVVAGTVVVLAALTLFTARAGARRPVAAVLRSD